MAAHNLSSASFCKSTQAKPDYYKIARLSPNYRIWRPLLEILLLAFFTIVFILIWLIMAALFDIAYFNNNLDMLGDLNSAHFFPFFLSMCCLIILIPATYLAVRLGGKRKFGEVLSVTGRFRTILFWRAAILALPFIILTMFFPLEYKTINGIIVNLDSVKRFLLVVLLVPFQAAAEELVFRGLLSQIFGAWFSCIVFPILISAFLFVIGHDYNWIGLIDITAFAICMGLLVWVTGGLEVPIAIHSVMNILAFTPSCFGIPTSGYDVTVSEATSGVVIIITLTTLIIKYPRLLGVARWK